MFINTKYFSPVVNDGITRAHPKSFEYKTWWDIQRDRCINGYTVGGTYITGDHYFYLNFWKIRGIDTDSGRKDLISPRFLDMDHEFFIEVEKARKSGKNMCTAKRRQCGFSEKTACLVGKEYTLFPHSQSLILGGEEKYSNATMRMVIRGLNSLKDTEFYKRRTPDGLDYIQAKYKVIEDGIPIWRGSQSEIYNITCKNNPQATVGKSPSFVLFEESGKFPGLVSTYRYLQPSMEANFTKTGFCIMIGTGGEMAAGADEFEEVFYKPEVYDMMSYSNSWGEGFSDTKVCYFVPAWKFALIDEDGNSEKEKSVEMILKNREKAKESKDASNWIQVLTQMPLTPEECFMRTGGNMFDIAKLNSRLAAIRNDRELLNKSQRGDLEWVRDNLGKITGVEWIQDLHGKFIVYEHPMKDATGNVYYNLYKAATDSYDKDEANTSSSKGSCQVFKTFLDVNSSSRKYVARITERPKKADDFYEMTAKLSYYYMAPNLIEWSNIGIFKWYEQNNMSHFLKERPRVAYANIKDSKVNNRWGIDPSTKQYWLVRYREYIKENTDKMDDVDQIIAAINFRDEKGYNCDITISSALCIVHEEDDLNIAVKSKENKKMEFFHYKSSKSGTLAINFN